MLTVLPLYPNESLQQQRDNKLETTNLDIRENHWTKHGSLIQHDLCLVKTLASHLRLQQLPVGRVVVAPRHMALPSRLLVKDVAPLLGYVGRSVYCRVAGQFT